jgi:hypothetical protein
VEFKEILQTSPGEHPSQETRLAGGERLNLSHCLNSEGFAIQAKIKNHSSF